jgi:hypothetical protein
MAVWVVALLILTLGLTVAAMLHALIKLWPSLGLLTLPGLLVVPLSAPLIFGSIILQTRTLLLLMLFVFLGASLEIYRCSVAK